MLPTIITVAFFIIVGLVVAWALFVTLRSHLRWRRASRSVDRTIAKVAREQALLSEGLIPEFAIPGDTEQLKQRYLAGEDIPLRWRNPNC
jgi:hypothetical protein